MGVPNWVAGARGLLTMKRIVLSSLAAIVLVASMTAVVLPSIAKDSHAPPEASERWLPCESWVQYHWIPYNEKHLYALTGIKRSEFRRWIREDHINTLGGLVKRKGKDPDEIVEKLMHQWHGKVSAEKFTELKRRADATMTQGHLAQHVFFHYFHNPTLAFHARSIFNVAPGDYQSARLQGWTPREIAEEGGVRTRTAVRRAMRAMARSQTRAVKTKQTTRAQANMFLRQQREWLDVWLKQSIHTHRKGEFPRGKKVKGSRVERACKYLAGSSHPDGKYDDSVVRRGNSAAHAGH